MRAFLCLLLSLWVGAMHAQKRFDYFFLEAEKHRMASDYAAATELYRHCLDINPDAPEALYGMGLMQYILRNDSVGDAMLCRACAIDSCNPWYLTTLASVYLQKRNTDRVVPVLERLARLDPRRSDVQSQLVGIYQSIDQPLKAIEALNQIERNEGMSTALSLEKSSIYMEMGEREKAFAELQALCDEFPHDMNCLVLAGNQYSQAGETERALAIYDEVRRHDPSNERLQYAMLSHYMNTGQRDRYLSMRDSMLFAPGSSSDMRTTMMRIYITDARTDSLPTDVVWAAFDSLLAMPQHDVSMLMLKAAYQSTSDTCTEEHINATMREVLKVDPSHRVALEQLLQYYGRVNDLPALEEVCRRGINYYPESLPYHFYLGIALFQQQRTTEAIDALRQGLQLRDEDTNERLISDVFSLVGDACHTLNRETEAFAAYDSALVYNPDNILSLNNYAYYLSLRNEDLDRAEEMSYRAVRAEPQNKTYLDTYAWILFMKEDYAGARRYMERVVNPDLPEDSLLADEHLSPVVFEHAGDIYAQCGQLDEALYYWGLAMRNKAEASPLLRKKLKKKKYIK